MMPKHRIRKRLLRALDDVFSRETKRRAARDLSCRRVSLRMQVISPESAWYSMAVMRVLATRNGTTLHRQTKT
jgi:hypothetical protein